MFLPAIISQDIQNLETIEQLMVYEDLIDVFSETELSKIEKDKLKQEIEQKKTKIKNE